MNSQGIGGDTRRPLLRGNVFALAIAVLVGTALFQLLWVTVEYLAIPLARGVFDKRSEIEFGYDPLYLPFNGYPLYFGEVLTMAITLTVAILLIVLLRRRLALDREDEPDFAEELGLSACPECLSLIPSAARRCAYCTAPVAPPPPERQE